MSRVQLALNVSDLDEATEHYTKLFGTKPAKVRPGYANFAIAEPPLKLVLVAGVGTPGTLDHIGIEVGSAEEVAEAKARCDRLGLTTTTEDEVTCCHALQDKVWVDGPDELPWEVYTVLADAPVRSDLAGDGRCCSAATGSEKSCCP